MNALPLLVLEKKNGVAAKQGEKSFKRGIRKGGKE